MNRRQKILIGIAGLIALGFVMYLVVDRVFLVPAAQRMNDAKEVIAKINHARAEKKKEGTYQNRLKELAAMTFSLDENHSSEQVRSRVAEILGQSGLSAQNLSLKPLVSSRVPGVYKEIGWLVRARGKITHVINFLYLLSREPHLHRLDNLILSPVPGGTDVELQVKYGTLVLELPKGEKAETDRTAEDSEPLVLQGAERGQYETIATRNLFLPYIPAAPVQKPPPAEGPRTPTEPTAPRVPEGRYRLVGLPAWGGQPDVLISDAYSGKVASYKLGDDLAGGKIVTVDYRPLPLPSRPDVVSASRVVLQVGARYYAVELGTSLAEKRPLPDDQVPPNLPKLEAPPAPQPAAAAEKSDTHK